jgi:hypothetical protein
MVAVGDAAAVVGDAVDDPAARSRLSGDDDPAGAASVEVFDGVVDQIAKNLLDREPVAVEPRQRLDHDFGP